MRLESRLFCREMKTRGAVYSISIEQCHPRHPQVRAHRDQFLRNRSPFEEAECGTGMEFDVHECPNCTSRRFCHPEQSEGSAVRRKMQIPRFARDDNFKNNSFKLPASSSSDSPARTPIRT